MKSQLTEYNYIYGWYAFTFIAFNYQKQSKMLLKTVPFVSVLSAKKHPKPVNLFDKK